MDIIGLNMCILPFSNIKVKNVLCQAQIQDFGQQGGGQIFKEEQKF